MIFGWFKNKVVPPKEKWDITLEEALVKYGSATKVLNELAKDYKLIKTESPILNLLLIERNEKRKKK